MHLCNVCVACCGVSRREHYEEKLIQWFRGKNHTSPSDDHETIFTWTLAIAVAEGREWIGLVPRGRWGKVETFICSDHEQSATTVPVRPAYVTGFYWIYSDSLQTEKRRETTWHKTHKHRHNVILTQVFSLLFVLLKKSFEHSWEVNKETIDKPIYLWDSNKNRLEAQIPYLRCNEGIFAYVK